MFNTIKSKIILITILMLITLSILFCSFTYMYLKFGKFLTLDRYSYTIDVFAKNINKEIVKIENNAKDLALHGELFYKIDKNKTIAENTIIQLFNNYQDSLGGGIWFKPNRLNPHRTLYCIYAYRNKSGQVVIDNSFETEAYNYPQKSWYIDIMSELETDNDNIAWSLPYFEKEGSNTLMVTAGSGIFYNKELVGLSTVDWEISSIIKAVSEIKPTKNTFALFADKEHDYIIASNDPYLNNIGIVGKSIKTLPWYNDNLKNITYFDYHNKKYVPYVKTLDNGMVLIVNIPKHEMFMTMYKHVFGLFIGLMFISLIISSLLYLGLKKYINMPIEKLTDIANKISSGDLDTKIKLEKPEEFAKLAETFNNMTADIKNITKERERIESELELAQAIQSSSLPNIFPPFPDNKEFDIYAGMTPAKEVGGDFYDFYFIDDDNMMFIIADVSGKGVPAALFMMTVKTLINYIAQSGLSPKEMIKTINKKICANNKQGFFVTMIAGIVNVKTGKLTLINCGHNPPLIKQHNEDFKYLHLNTNIVLGIFENADFEPDEIQLSENDTIMLYTDGITEAVNSTDEMFGEERLLKSANSYKDTAIDILNNSIKSDVKNFVKDVAQSDDMTTLIFKYKCKKDANVELYSEIASKENYNNFLKWLMKSCEKYNVDFATQTKLELISEEIYTNIFSYAYVQDEGMIYAQLKKQNNCVTLEFSDNGIPFNPLDRPDPDTDFPPESREKGGFGIFIVKNTVDKIDYKYENNKNILTLQIFV